MEPAPPQARMQVVGLHTSLSLRVFAVSSVRPKGRVIFHPISTRAITGEGQDPLDCRQPQAWTQHTPNPTAPRLHPNPKRKLDFESHSSGLDAGDGLGGSRRGDLLSTELLRCIDLLVFIFWGEGAWRESWGALGFFCISWAALKLAFGKIWDFGCRMLYAKNLLTS